VMLAWAGSDRALAQFVGVSESSISKKRRMLGIKPTLERYQGLADYSIPCAPAEVGAEVQRDRETLRLKSELAEVKRKYIESCARGNLHEDILEVAKQEMGKILPATILPPKVDTSKTEEDAILGWADWHGGAVFGPDVMQGYNAYDPTIMCRRAQYTVDHTLKILYGCQSGTTFGCLYVLDLGDSIEGDHLPEQMATNALPVFEAMRMVVEVKSQALTELSSHLPVVYVSVPGNHGRRGQKMQWNLPTETADWLIGEMIADRVSGNERIQCVIPKAWTAGVTIRGYNHSLNHGFSAAKGGHGGISWYSFQRADGQKTALEAAHGRRVHYRWHGHIHQKAEIPMMDGEGTQHIVGSLMGGNPYALEALNKYSDPSQKLVGCHDEYGVTWSYPLDVKHADGESGRYEELLA
jgi:hypothetical protein